jgi:glycosyltransferase involved in cell wall biosynthesis
MILNIINPHASYYLGGTEVVTLHQALSLAKRGHTVRYFTRKPDQYSDYFREFQTEAKKHDITIVEIALDESTPYANSDWSLYYYLSNQFGMAAQPEYAKYNDADLVVTHLHADSLYVPYGAKNLLHLHGAPGQTDSLMTTAVTRPDYAVAHSTSIRDWWHEQFPALPINDTFRNGVDTQLYAGSPDDERDIDVLYVGRFLPHKGIDDILQSVNQGMRVVIAGNGPYLDELKSMATDKDLGKVTFIERPGNDELRQLYKTAKVFACPSRAKEGVLTTMLEAGAAGCAIVTTSGSGMTDLAVDGQNSRVITPGDTAALSEVIGQLLSDDSQRKQLATNIQRDIQATWSWDAKGLELEQIYEQAITA